MQTDQNLATLARAVSHWNEGDRERYYALYGPEVVMHGLAGVDPGLPSVRRYYESFWTAFPGSQLTLQDAFGHEDRVAARFAVTGSHDGPFLHLPATGRAFHFTGITILRFSAGVCVERWTQADFLGLLQQLGAMPAPP